MGLRERLHHFDEEEPEPEPPAATRAKVDAILRVIGAFLDRDNSMAMTLFVIARRELASASEEQINVVVRGILFAADQLRSFAPAEPAAADGA